MLRAGTPSEINEMFIEMEKVRRSTLDAVIQLVYFMRGSIQYREMLSMSYLERQMVSEFIEKRLENESEKMYPIY